MKQLTSKQINTLNRIDDNIKLMFKSDATGHDYDHMKRVVNLTARLLVDKSDPFVAYCIAYFHDVFDDKLDNAFASLEALVKAWDLDLEGKDQRIKEDIFSLGYKGGFIKTEKSLEAQIVYEADLLDAMGAVGIARAFYYAGFKGLPFHDNDLEGQVATNLEEYRHLKRNAIAHFEEKLLRLNKEFITPKGQEIAKERHKRLQDFYNAFYEEIQGEDV